MKLTSTIGSDVYLEIFVISDRKASNEQLLLEFSDKFLFNGKIQKKYIKENLTGFASSTFNLNVGHPEVQNLLWNGCILTKFSGTLNSEQMNRDLVFNLNRNNPYRIHYWTIDALLQRTKIVFLIVFTVLFISIHSYLKKSKKWKLKYPFVLALVLSLLLSTAAAGINYSMLSEIQGQNITSYYEIIHVARKHTLIKGLEETIEEKYEKSNNINIDNIKNLLEESIGKYLRRSDTINPYTQQLMQYEDSPGNYVIIEDKRGIIFRIFDDEGFPEDFVLQSKESIKDANSK